VAGSVVPALADSVGPGGTAAIVVFILILACVALFFAFVGSLRRLRQNTSRGTFNTGQHGQHGQHGDSAHPSDHQSDRAQSGDAVTPDQAGPGGASA
jgi:hypothetical protein